MRSNLMNRGRVRAGMIGAGVSAMLLLSGCSASYWPAAPTVVAEPEATVEASNIAPVPVSDAQIESIVRAVARTAAEGDASLDAEALEARFSGDALAQRAANYRIRGAVSEYGSIPAAITDERLGYQLVQSTESWPRTLLVTVASKADPDADAAAAAEDAASDEDAGAAGESDTEIAGGEAPSLALFLTQRVPQENFHVTRAISLRGGIVMPKAAPAEEGTALLSDDIDSLLLQPGEVGNGYAAILQGGTEVEEAAEFDLEDDPLIGNYGRAWAAEAKQKADADDKSMNYSVTVRQGEEQIVSLSTGVGGALVATTIVEEQVLDSAGGRWKPQAEGAVGALSGLSGQQDRIVRQVSHQLLFYVPGKADGAKVQLLGVTSELVGAGN